MNKKGKWKWEILKYWILCDNHLSKCRIFINIFDKPGDKVYILFSFCTVLARQAFTSFVANFFHFVWDGFGQFLDVFLFFLTEAHEGAANVAHRLVNGKRVSERVSCEKLTYFLQILHIWPIFLDKVIQPISLSQQFGIWINFFFYSTSVFTVIHHYFYA